MEVMSEVYDCLERQSDLVETAREGAIYGPNFPSDMAVIEESRAFRDSPQYRSKQASRRQLMHFGEASVLSDQPSRSEQSCFEIGSDMLLLAYGGVLRYAGVDDVKDLHTWQMSEAFGELVPSEKALQTYHSLPKETRDRIRGVSQRAIDKHVKGAIGQSALRSVYHVLHGNADKFNRGMNGVWMGEHGNPTLEKLITAGIMVPDNWAEDGGRYHVKSKDFLKLFPRDKKERNDWNLEWEMDQKREETIRRLAKDVGSRDPEKDKDLMRIDRYVLKNLFS